MKKAFPLLLITSMLLSGLAACGSDTSSVTEVSSNTSAEKETSSEASSVSSEKASSIEQSSKTASSQESSIQVSSPDVSSSETPASEPIYSEPVFSSQESSSEPVYSEPVFSSQESSRIDVSSPEESSLPFSSSAYEESSAIESSDSESTSSSSAQAEPDLSIYPDYEESDDDQFVLDSKNPYAGGSYTESDELPSLDSGNDYDAWYYTTKDIMLMKRDGVWYQTEYTKEEEETANNGHKLYLLSDNRLYDAGADTVVTVAADSDHDGIEDSKDEDNTGGSISGTFDKSDVGLSYSFSHTVDYSQFFSLDNTVFHKSLAQLAMTLSNAAYRKSFLIEGEETVSARAKLPEMMGGKDILDVELSDSEYTEDHNDTYSAVLFHYDYKEDDEVKEVFVVDFSGTANSWEWNSNFDFGVDCTEYTERTGTHKGWRNKKNHKGFDVALNRFIPVFEKYVMENNLGTDTPSVFITGHSRGGSLANLFGEYVAEKNTYRPYTYTFATPTCTIDKKDTNSIFNIINDNDMITHLPMKDVLGFERNGTDMIYSNEDYIEEYKELYPDESSEITNDGALIPDMLTKLSDTPEGYYEIKKDDDHRFYPSYTKTYTTREQAEKKMKENTDYLDKTNPSTMYEAEITETDDGKFGYEIYSCPAAFANMLTTLFQIDSDDSMTLMTEFLTVSAACPKSYTDIMTTLSSNHDNIGVNHMTSCYQAIVESLED